MYPADRLGALFNEHRVDRHAAVRPDVATPGRVRSVPREHHAGSGVPPAQLSWPIAVVGKEEVLDRVLLTPAASREVVTNKIIDSPLVRLLPCGPLGLTEDGQGKHIGHRTSVGAFEWAARAGGT